MLERAKTYHKPIYRSYTSRPSDPDAKYKLTKFGLLLNFAFSPPVFFHFSCLSFFSLAGHLVGFILVGNVFKKAFRILGLGERKGRWAVEQGFLGNFQVNVTWFLVFFCSFLD